MSLRSAPSTPKTDELVKRLHETVAAIDDLEKQRSRVLKQRNALAIKLCDQPNGLKIAQVARIAGTTYMDMRRNWLTPTPPTPRYQRRRPY